MSTDRLVARMKAFAIVGEIEEWIKMGMNERQLESFEKIGEILNDEATCYQTLESGQYTLTKSREMKIVS